VRHAPRVSAAASRGVCTHSLDRDSTISKVVTMQRNSFHRSHHTGTPSSVRRRGAAVVEFAVMAPLFLLLGLGAVEMGYALNASNTMYGVGREGGRLASQDFTKSLAPGQTANEKVIQDIKNMLPAAGIDGDNVTVTIEHADAPG